MMGDFKNEVTFSPSQEKTLSSCERMFYYARYRSWGGWWNRGNPPPPSAESAYKAKNATTRHMLIGTLVHERAAWALNHAKRRGTRFIQEWGGESKVVEAAKSTCHDQIDAAIESSLRDGPYNPKKTIKLIELTGIGEQWDPDDLRTWMHGKVDAKLDALFSDHSACTMEGSDAQVNLLWRALHRGESVVSIEKLVEFTAGGIKAFMQLDLAMKGKDAKHLVIIDWKTGRRRDSDVDQIVAYSVWARRVGWRSASMLLAYLDGGMNVVPVEMEASVADREFAERIDAYLAKLRPKLVDGDIDRNEPIESEFQPTTDLSTCRMCQFASICERDGTKPGGTSGMDAF